MTKLSIIIPCLNEEENVEQILDSVTAAVSGKITDYEIIIVDDQSDDSTLSLAQKWSVENPNSKVRVLYKELHRRGYGAAVKYGLAFAEGEYAIFVSADCVDPIHLMPEMYQLLESGYDLIQVSRYLEKNNSSTIPFSYKFYQFFYRRGVLFSLGQWIPDSTYAFKMFRRTKVLATGLSANRFNISPEIMFKAILSGMKIKFISGAQGTRVGGESKFKFHKEGIGFGMCLIRAFCHRKGLIYWF
ncbi:glycosyltransferase family 2 protein [Chromobacterium violaceum]|uniref:glycosyltransferase family 2 protein n=1 Tax=Chromobacterium violaceum TaxID=536 RepID=UPI0006919E94|nr:glycosyltransferase family 2 protein [Chromobacterium violaceum]OLZ80803.1 glycosyl transferase family 2 [Chromobacterium violaceum]STB69116.1 Bactoprenol glucosyl transferase homolog from prophage CPS-53 [Chromobacterium violaceum]